MSLCVRCGAMISSHRYSRFNWNMCIHIRAITFSIFAPLAAHSLDVPFAVRSRLHLFFALSFFQIDHFSYNVKFGFVFFFLFFLRNSCNNRETISLSAQHRYQNTADSHISSEINVQLSYSVCEFTRLIWFEICNVFPGFHSKPEVWFAYDQRNNGELRKSTTKKQWILMKTQREHVFKTTPLIQIWAFKSII